MCGIVSNVLMKITIVPRPQDGSIIISVEAHMINYEEPISQIKCGYSPGIIYVWYVDDFTNGWSEWYQSAVVY